VHGLLGILPKLIGLCHYSLLIGGAFFGGFHAAKSVPVGTGSLSQTAHLLSLGEMAPAQSTGICFHGKLGRDLRGELCYQIGIELAGMFACGPKANICAAKRKAHQPSTPVNRIVELDAESPPLATTQNYDAARTLFAPVH